MRTFSKYIINEVRANEVNEVRPVYINKSKGKNRPQIRCSADSNRLLLGLFEQIDYFEEFWVIFLNRRAEAVSTYCVSKGGVAGTIVDAKLVFAMALVCGASSMVLAHNHPSGNPKPSQADFSLTQKLVKAGELLDIFVLDHLIVTSENGYYSFADEGTI